MAIQSYIKPIGLSTALTLVALAGTAVAAPNVSRSKDTLSWGPCDGAPAPFECAKFQVPLDWADADKGNATLAIIRLPASTQPSEGYMFYNFGGPAISGVQLLSGPGSYLQRQLGPSWDLVSWDPRGVGSSGPDVTLFNSTESNQFWEQTRGLGNLDSHGNLTARDDIAFFMNQSTAFDELAVSWNDKMVKKAGDNLQYIGTVAVTRDLVAMTDAIYGEDADVNFYGFSYGVRIGVYLTQMFTHRVGKMIFDGVLDPYTWSNEQPIGALGTDVQDAEIALGQWTTFCAKAPSKCSLAALGNGTADSILAVIDEILDSAYHMYDGSTPPATTGWTYDEIANQVFNGLFSTLGWAGLSDYLVSIIQSQRKIKAGTASANPTTLNAPPGAPLSAETRFAINCADAPNGFVPMDQVFRVVVAVSQFTSQHFGSLLNPRWLCARYTTRAVERLPAPMNIIPKKVVLVIGNEWDPMTPFSESRDLASRYYFGNMSRLVKLKAIGHSSAFSNSTCLDNVIHSFVRDDIPQDAGDDGPDVECDINGNPFDFL